MLAVFGCFYPIEYIIICLVWARNFGKKFRTECPFNPFVSADNVPLGSGGGGVYRLGRGGGG